MLPLPVIDVALPLVTFQDLTVVLGGRAILDQILTAIPRGKVTALIGLNGSGKTTLLRALVREYPYRGEIRFHCGHDHSRPTPEHVGYVPQRLTLDSRLPLTVRDFLALALSRRPLFLGIPRALSEKIHGLLARVDMADHIDQLVDKLS